MADIEIINGADNGNPPDTLRQMYPKVNRNFQKLNSEVGANKTDADNKLDAHKSSTSAHSAQNITYTGDVIGATNVKQALDNTKQTIDDLILGSGDSGPEVAAARGGYQTLGDRLDVSDAKLAEKANKRWYDAKDYGAVGDGVTDDTLAIRAAVNASVNSVCFIPKGTYVVSKITIPNNVHIIIEGTLKLKDGANNQLLELGSNVTIQGNGIGTLDGNAIGQTTSAVLACVYGGSSTNPLMRVKLEGLVIKNSKNWPVNLSAVESLMKDCILCDSPNMAFFGPGSKRCWIVNCTCYNISNDWGLGFYGNVEDCVMYGCVAYNVSQSGLGILSDEHQQSPSNNVIIANCLAYSNGGPGITVGAYSGSHKNVTISSCISRNNNTANGSLPSNGGIVVERVSYINITGCVIHHNGNGSNGSVGIGIKGNVKNLTISNNNIHDEGQGSAASGYGILAVGVAIENVIIESNIFDDDQTTKTMASHISLNSAVASCIIKNNIFGDNIAGRDKLYVSTPPVWTSGNIGYNPVGRINNTPSVPSSGTAYTSNYNFPCRVFISGGTVTSIAINGTSTGLTSGAFVLDTKETITITYSATPTWTWFGL